MFLHPLFSKNGPLSLRVKGLTKSFFSKQANLYKQLFLDLHLTSSSKILCVCVCVLPFWVLGTRLFLYHCVCPKTLGQPKEVKSTLIMLKFGTLVYWMIFLKILM